MSIEKDINQKKFRNENQKVMINLIYTYNWITERSKAILERGDVTGQQYNILRILRGAGAPLSTLQIRQRMLDKMSDTSRIVDRLIVKGLVNKTVSSEDKRLVDVSISDKGKKLLKNLDQYDTEMDAITGTLSGNDTKKLNKLLDKIRNSC